MISPFLYRLGLPDPYSGTTIRRAATFRVAFFIAFLQPNRTNFVSSCKHITYVRNVEEFIQLSTMYFLLCAVTFAFPEPNNSFSSHPVS
jgi:hypothetical protein